MITTPTPPPLQLLTDDQMRQFITRGFLQLKTAMPRETNDIIFQKLDEASKTGGHVGNNALPFVPELKDMLDDPIVRGAIVSVLGPSAVVHQHRFMHRNRKIEDGKPGWHKDSYWGYRGRLRSHRPWWAMIMYYPQDTTLDMGPTAVLPGRQHYCTRDPDNDTGASQVIGEAGTFFLIHYDLWHAAWPAESDLTRFMCKFEFLRLDPPTQPTWNCEDPQWKSPGAGDDMLCTHEGMWRAEWDWLAGQATPSGSTADSPSSPSSIAELTAMLDDERGQVRADAADQLATFGSAAAPALTPLVKQLADPWEPAAINAIYALASIGSCACDAIESTTDFADDVAQRHAALAISQMGAAAIPVALRWAKDNNPRKRAAAAHMLGAAPATDELSIATLKTLTADEDTQVRLWAVEAAGVLGAAGAPLTDVLIDRLRDDNDEVRFFTPLSIARIGAPAAAATPALTQALRDPNRYVRGHAVEALDRIDTPESREALIDHLKAARWCPITTPDNPFYP